MEDFNLEECVFIFVFILVATVAELLDTLVQFILPIPNNFITFTMIVIYFVLWFKREIKQNQESKSFDYLNVEEKNIKYYASLDLKERAILNKFNKQSLIKLIVFFSLVWIIISTVFILFFANYFDKRNELSIELINFFVMIFFIIGISIMAICIRYELKNTFPDLRKIFEKYGYEAIENYKGYIENETWKTLKMHYLYVNDKFIGKLKNNSMVEYKINLWVDDFLQYKNVEITNVGINIDIEIDMRKVLKNNLFELIDEDEIMARFSKYFTGKLIIDKDDIQYNRGFFNINLEKTINKNVSIDYLVAVMKACQELEDTFNFPIRNN